MSGSKSRINPGNGEDGASGKEAGAYILLGMVSVIVGFMLWVMSVTP